MYAVERRCYRLRSWTHQRHMVSVYLEEAVLRMILRRRFLLLIKCKPAHDTPRGGRGAKRGSGSLAATPRLGSYKASRGACRLEKHDLYIYVLCR